MGVDDTLTNEIVRRILTAAAPDRIILFGSAATLVVQWCEKADRDFEAADHLQSQDGRFREIVALHCQQAVEKYLKALLVRHQIEFPKTHDILKLLGLIATIHPDFAASLRDADVLTPFGVEARYPSDAPELLPGGETDAFALPAGRSVK